jgi:hypothetical protein
MDFLRSLFGSLTSSVLRLAVTVGTLAAVYFFILKPILDTTNETVDKFSQPLNQSLQLSQQQFQQAQRQIRQGANQADVPQQQAPGQVQITRTLSGLTPRQARKLTRCIQRNQGSVSGFNRCFDRAQRKARRG